MYANEFLETLSPMQSGKAAKHLFQEVLYNKKICNRASVVIDFIKEGRDPIAYKNGEYYLKNSQNIYSPITKTMYQFAVFLKQQTQ